MSSLQDMFKEVYVEAIAKQLKQPLVDMIFYYAPAENYKYILHLMYLKSVDTIDESALTLPEGLVWYDSKLGVRAEGLLSVNRGGKPLFCREFMLEVPNSYKFVLEN